MNDAYQQMAVDAISHAANMAGENVRIVVAEYARPSVVWKPRLYVEGNQWCALLGDNLQEGVAGFGGSPAEAMLDFDKQWFAKLPTIEGVPQPPAGYTADELERDNPFNQWMYDLSLQPAKAK